MSDYHVDIFYSEEGRGNIADIPDLPHCSGFGKSPAAALAELSVARESWLAAAHAAGRPTPAPRHRPAIYQVET